jgi:predicted  nucleic acid-binding Zn-ribbon protein
LQDKDSQLQRTQERLNRTNEELESSRYKLAAAEETSREARRNMGFANLKLKEAERAMGEQSAAAEEKLSAANAQLRNTEARLNEAQRERERANIENNQSKKQLAELTQQNENLENGVGLLESNLNFTRSQILSAERQRDSLAEMNGLYFKQLKATHTELTARTEDLYRVQGENEFLRTQLGEKEQEIEGLRANLGGLVNALHSEVTGESAQVVLGGLRKLKEVAATLPPDIAINVHVQYLDRTISTVGDIGNAIAELEDEIFTAPERRLAEFQRDLETIAQSLSIGAVYGEEHDQALERLCKNGAGIDVDHADRAITGQEFLGVANVVTRKSFEVLLREDPSLTELRGKVGSSIDIDAHVSKYLPGVGEEFTAYGQESHSFHEYFNKLGELVIAARNQAIEDVKNQAAAMLLEAIKTNNSDADCASLIEACGGQGECFARMVNVEADRVATLVAANGGISPEAIEDMRQRTAFHEVDNVNNFLIHSRIQLAQAFGAPLAALARHRFVDQGNGTWQDPDAVKTLFTQINSECNGIVSGLNFVSYLNERSSAENVENTMRGALAIAHGQIGEDFVNFFTGDQNTENVTLRLNNFIFHMLQPIGAENPEVFNEAASQWVVKSPGEEMVACFCKTAQCLAEGDTESSTFHTSRNKFSGQFFLTAYDSLYNLQHFLPIEFAPAFEYQKSACQQLFNISQRNTAPEVEFFA